MGPHNMQLAVMSSGRATNLPIPHLPSPWASRPSLSPLIIPSNNQASTTAAQAPPAASRSPSEVVHRGIICDHCNDTIKGIRHKCLDCPGILLFAILAQCNMTKLSIYPDYDLCTSCITNGGAETHNPFHEFFEITEPGRVIVHTVLSGDGERETPRVPARNIAQEAPRPSEPVVHPATCDLCESRIIGSRYVSLLLFSVLHFLLTDVFISLEMRRLSRLRYLQWLLQVRTENIYNTLFSPCYFFIQHN